MRLPTAYTAFTLSALLLLAPFAEAESCCKIAVSYSPMQQAATAEVVVIGKVTEIEPIPLSASEYSNGGPVGHMVAIVHIEEALLGAKGVTHIRVGFIPGRQQPYQEEFAFGFGGQGRSWRGPATLSPSQEGCFFLQKHATEDFYVQVPMGYPLTKGDLNYDSEMAAVKTILRAFDKPTEALQAKEAGDRQRAACALMLRYGTPRHVGKVDVAKAAIPAEESKLILKALAEMKFGEVPFDQNGTMSLQNVFWQLQLTDKDGWKQPQQKENEDYNEIMGKAVSQWLKDNAEKYRIQRFVENSGKTE